MFDVWFHFEITHVHVQWWQIVLSEIQSEITVFCYHKCVSSYIMYWNLWHRSTYGCPLLCIFGCSFFVHLLSRSKKNAGRWKSPDKNPIFICTKNTRHVQCIHFRNPNPRNWKKAVHFSSHFISVTIQWC